VNHLETEEPSKPSPAFLLTLGIVGIILGAAIAGEFVLRLQPGLGGNVTVSGGTVLMPLGVGSNTQLNFDPPKIVVIIGVNNTVTFQNDDSVHHTVTATDNSFNSGDILPNQKFTYTFSTAGNFTYYCIYHSSWMRAQVVVESETAGGAFTIKIPPGTGSDSTLNFSPSSVTLVVGVNNTLTVVNDDSVKQTVTASDGSFDSGDILPGQSWTHTFPAGTYTYHCIYHSYMTGTIVVKSP
jgi:plastocyanin